MGCGSDVLDGRGLTLGGCRLAFGMGIVFGRKERHLLLTWLANNDRSIIQSDLLVIFCAVW